MNMNLNLQILFTIAEYIGRKLLLQSPSEQSRLLEKLPGVIADVVEIEPVFDNSFTKESHISVEVDLPQESHISDYEVQSDLRRKRHHPVSEIKKRYSKSLFMEEVQERPLSFASESQSSVIPEKQHQGDPDIGEWKNQPTGIQKEQVENKSSKSVELDELSDHDRDHEDVHENPTRAVWYSLGPHDEVMGPYSMSMLKQWCHTTSYEMKYKVWKAGQSQKEAIFLTDAIHRFGSDIGGKRTEQPNEIQMEDMENKSSKSVKLIELSDSDEDGDCEVAHESPTCAVWHYLGPHGQIMGPYSMEMPKRWRDSSSYEMKYKVQSNCENNLLDVKALCRLFMLFIFLDSKFNGSSDKLEREK
ncbi:hypothetical protein FEM48_Zijuj08G0204600 [Ziziphus jujuba var. spinosa]|uniref:GYF domain-containing protein n=1 Tax=Ziziphus jujuba var. spinosa TaxID=714518 RepID=A0A978V179_ZIZJJ|nr:hypothetical protein FEM48_Zijuj08G0204600 [Ziziphus jujuba var. spinosa]